MFTIKRTTSNNPDFRGLITLLDKDLRSRYNELQDQYDQHNHVPDLDTVLIAYMEDKAVGCGCFRQFAPDTVEIKRMFVAPAHRGNGIAFSLLQELENWARELQFSIAVLETGKAQAEAIRLYEKSGYRIIPNYGPYVGMEQSICMKKAL